MGEREDDDGLLARIGSGDRHAFGRLMDRHADRVFTLARAVLGSAADAEDVTQEVFVTVWRKAEDWRSGGARFTTWLYRVTVNQSLNHKNRVASRHAPLDQAAEQQDPAPAADERLDANRRAQRVNAAVAALPESQRTAVTLTYTSGLSNADAAHVMAISVKALEALLVRARRTLRETLGGDA
jgi:RNA polymerase sigma-70 factor, ECF subfamily